MLMECLHKLPRKKKNPVNLFTSTVAFAKAVYSCEESIN